MAALVGWVSAGCGVATQSYERTGGFQIHRYSLSISNVYAIETDAGTVLVDTGDPGQHDDVLAAMERTEVPRDAVRLIVVTHAHADHAGSAAALSRALDAPIALQRGDGPTVAAGHNPPLHATSVTGTLLSAFLTQDYEAFEPALSFDDCFDLTPFGIAGVVRSTPGHTPGSSVILLDSGDALVGDLVRGGYLGGLVSPHTPTEHYYQDDPRQVRAVLEWLLTQGVEWLFLGHGGPVSAGALRTAIEGGDLGPPSDTAFDPGACPAPPSGG